MNVGTGGLNGAAAGSGAGHVRIVQKCRDHSVRHEGLVGGYWYLNILTGGFL